MEKCNSQFLLSNWCKSGAGITFTSLGLPLKTTCNWTPMATLTAAIDPWKLMKTMANLVIRHWQHLFHIEGVNSQPVLQIKMSQLQLTTDGQIEKSLIRWQITSTTLTLTTSTITRMWVWGGACDAVLHRQLHKLPRLQVRLYVTIAISGGGGRQHHRIVKD